MDTEVNNMGQMEPTPTPQTEGSAGPVIGTIIILAVIVLGGLYFWGQRTKAPVMDQTQVQEKVQSIQTQSSSDTPSDIKADLDATQIDNIDAQLQGL
jgi:hypothetical protein